MGAEWLLGDAAGGVLAAGGYDYGDAADGDCGRDERFGVELLGCDGAELYGEWRGGDSGGRIRGCGDLPSGFES